MASYPTPIIQLPTQQPFNMMQNPMINAYFSAMMKSKFEEMADERKQKSREINYKTTSDSLRKQYPGAEFEESVNSDGERSLKTKAPRELSNTDIVQSSMGLGSDQAVNTIASRMGATSYDIAEKNPNAAVSLEGERVGDINGQPIIPTSMDKRKYVAGALGKVPSIAAKQLPDTYKSDLMTAAEEANGDEDVLLDSLATLSVKYADNPIASSQLSKTIRDHLSNKKKTSSKESRRVSKLRPEV